MEWGNVAMMWINRELAGQSHGGKRWCITDGSSAIGLTCPHTTLRPLRQRGSAWQAVWRLYCREAGSADGRVAGLTGVTGVVLRGEAANNSDRSASRQRVLGEMSGCGSYWWKDEADRPRRMMPTGVPCLLHLASLSPSTFPFSFYLPQSLPGSRMVQHMPVEQVFLFYSSYNKWFSFHFYGKFLS